MHRAPTAMGNLLKCYGQRGSPFIYDELNAWVERKEPWKSVTSYQVHFQQGIPTYVCVAVS